MADQPKRPRGRPPTNLGRKPRNIQMTDEAYALLRELGKGKAADGVEIALQRIQAARKSNNAGFTGETLTRDVRPRACACGRGTGQRKACQCRISCAK